MNLAEVVYYLKPVFHLLYVTPVKALHYFNIIDSCLIRYDNIIKFILFRATNGRRRLYFYAG